jgi:hypothetical protein
MGVDPVHVPAVVPTICPSRSVPETSGNAVFTGGRACTIPVARESAADDPSAFVAVTRTLTVWATSADVSCLLLDVEPVISPHAAPVESHRNHWYAYVIVVELVHVPDAAFRI